jgi:4-hydroxy-tetrahydrodipicolinate reductase
MSTYRGPMNKLRIAVTGPRGRMGRAVLETLGEREDLELAAELGRGDRLDPYDADVAVDFTTAEGSVGWARAAAEAGGPSLVIGSTGFDPSQEAEIARAAERVAIVRSGNFSLGVNLLLGLVQQAARTLPPRDYDIEVFEAHHRRKADAPSGTALMLGEAAAKARYAELADVAVYGRNGVTGPRVEGAIGFSVMRGGGVVGEHSVVFAAEDEIITLSHSARDRRLFARGALAAAVWVARKPPGLYSMADVLGFAASA